MSTKRISPSARSKPRISEQELNQIDRKLQEMALLNFEVFCHLAGVDKTQAVVCFEIQKGRSIRQVGIKLKLSKSTVHVIAKKCPKTQDGK